MPYVDSIHAAALFTEGKRIAFDWLAKHPDASRTELIGFLSHCRTTWRRSSKLFDETVQHIADCVFAKREKWPGIFQQKILPVWNASPDATQGPTCPYRVLSSGQTKPLVKTRGFVILRHTISDKPEQESWSGSGPSGFHCRAAAR